MTWELRGDDDVAGEARTLGERTAADRGVVHTLPIDARLRAGVRISTC